MNQLRRESSRLNLTIVISCWQNSPVCPNLLLTPRRRGHSRRCLGSRWGRRLRQLRHANNCCCLIGADGHERPVPTYVIPTHHVPVVRRAVVGRAARCVGITFGIAAAETAGAGRIQHIDVESIPRTVTVHHLFRVEIRLKPGLLRADMMHLPIRNLAPFHDFLVERRMHDRQIADGDGAGGSGVCRA